MSLSRTTMVLLGCVAAACGRAAAPETPANTTPTSSVATAAPAALIEIARTPGRAASKAPVAASLKAPFTGDLDAIVERGQLRVLVSPGRTHFDTRGGVEKGRTHDTGVALEAWLNERLAPRGVGVTFIATPDDVLLRDLLAGRGDAVANLLHTFERDDQVAFAPPVRTGIRELLVLGPKEPRLVSLEDVGRRTVHVRRGSDHHASLVRLNEQLVKISRPPARIVFAPAGLTDEDLLERVNAGRIPATIANDYIVDAWRDTFDKVQVNRNVAISQDGVIAWVTRKDSPKLQALLREFFSTHQLTF